MYTEVAMRAFCTSVMALLVVAALFWGNCFSCPQVLLSADRHGCCHRTKVPKTECNTQSLKNFVHAEKSAPVSPMPAAIAVIVPPVEFAAAPVAVSPQQTLVSLSLAVPLRI